MAIKLKNNNLQNNITYIVLNIRLFKYKEGNNRPSSVNEISLVHNLDRTANKYYTQDNTDIRETQIGNNIFLFCLLLLSLPVYLLSTSVNM